MLKVFFDIKKLEKQDKQKKNVDNNFYGLVFTAKT